MEKVCDAIGLQVKAAVGLAGVSWVLYRVDGGWRFGPMAQEPAGSPSRLRTSRRYQWLLVWSRAEEITMRRQFFVLQPRPLGL